MKLGSPFLKRGPSSLPGSMRPGKDHSLGRSRFPVSPRRPPPRRHARPNQAAPRLAPAGRRGILSDKTRGEDLCAGQHEYEANFR